MQKFCRRASKPAGNVLGNMRMTPSPGVGEDEDRAEQPRCAAQHAEPQKPHRRPSENEQAEHDGDVGRDCEPRQKNPEAEFLSGDPIGPEDEIVEHSYPPVLTMYEDTDCAAFRQAFSYL